MLRTAVNAPRALLAALRAHAPAARVVHLSTDQVFDGAGHSLAEDAAPGPVSPTARYRKELRSTHGSVGTGEW